MEQTEKTELQLYREANGFTIEDVVRRTISHGYDGGDTGHLTNCIYWIESRGQIVKSPRPRKTIEFKYLAMVFGIAPKKLWEGIL